MRREGESAEPQQREISPRLLKFTQLFQLVDCLRRRENTLLGGNRCLILKETEAYTWQTSTRDLRWHPEQRTHFILPCSIRVVPQGQTGLMRPGQRPIASKKWYTKTEECTTQRKAKKECLIGHWNFISHWFNYYCTILDHFIFFHKILQFVFIHFCYFGNSFCFSLCLFLSTWCDLISEFSFKNKQCVN